MRRGSRLGVAAGAAGVLALCVAAPASAAFGILHSFGFDVLAPRTADGQLSDPHAVALDAAGNVDVADQNNDRVQKFSAGGQHLGAFGAAAAEIGQLNGPSDVAVDAAGNVYVADTDNHRIRKYDLVRQRTVTWGSEGTGDGQFELPSGIAVDAAGTVYVADSNNHRVQMFSSEGAFLGKFGGPPDTPRLCEGQFTIRRASTSTPPAGSTSPIPATSASRCSARVAPRSRAAPAP